MMDHKAFVSALPAELREAMTARSDGPGLRHLALHLGAILLVGGLIATAVPGWWALLPVQGVLIVFLFTLEHEATHRTPFASARLNDEVGRAAGFLLLLPFEWFRYFHLAHHRWTNIDGKDPELLGGKPETLRAWLWHVSGLPYWWSGLRLMAALAAGRAEGDYLPEAAKPRIVAEARGMAVGYLVVGVGLIWSPLLWWVWILPVLLGQPALRLYLLAEHGDCPRVANMLQNTRTTFTNRLMRFLAWNMPYHTEHHVWPAVPFHRLPEVHQLMRDKLQVTAEGYAAFTKAYLERRL
ncbi:fatty acid desaturase [Tabrizicola sp.]|uniref:fatty acid desaturase n=1 Tax=Tabrizicola sp. TaxID=2005166 RepID=UPI002622A8BB|nr:fatty acid desaturase [Tabrizicola sp.]MDM7931154.1 fatty acid desaturase [Tabrizicola sp.]